MKRILVAAVAAILSLYAVPARADVPSVDLTTAPEAGETTVPFLELVGDDSHAAHATFRLTAGAQVIGFRRPFTGKDPAGADSDVHLLGGGPAAWLIADDVPRYVGGRTGYDTVRHYYRLTPDGRTEPVPAPSADGQVSANARFYATLPRVGSTVSVYRIATGRLVARRTFGRRGVHSLGQVVGRRLVVNVGSRTLLWSVGSRTARRLPGPVLALARDTVVFAPGRVAPLCSRVATLDRPTATLWSICGPTTFDALSPDGRLIITTDAASRQGLHDRDGTPIASFAKGAGVFGWDDPSTVTFVTLTADPSRPVGLTTCTLADCHRDRGHRYWPSPAEFLGY